jgi:isopenicillin-N epimerase
VREFGRAIRGEWTLEDGMAFLNHGSFGACPRVVLGAQHALRARMEAQPVRFLVDELPALMRASADHLAALVGARGGDLAWVDNATTGANAVVGSMRLGEGDEIVSSTHVYGAVHKTLLHYAVPHGARVVLADVPFPIDGPDAVVDACAAVIGPRTKLVVVDHVTSFSGLVWPIERVVALCRERGVPVLVDAAHAPGQVPMDLDRVGADYTVGNCHKWLFAPKGCAFLHVREDRQDAIHPTVISHGYGRGFLEEFDWVGTKDPSPWLALPAAIEFVESLGIDAMRAYQRDLCEQAVAMLRDRVGLDVPAPASMRAAMATLPHPWSREGTDAEGKVFHDTLWARDRVEVPCFAWGGRTWFRISAQVYGDLAEHERLADALLRGP